MVIIYLTGDERGELVFTPPKSFLSVFFGLGALSLFLLFLYGCGQSGSSSGQDDLLTSIIEKKELIAGVKYDAKPFGFLDTDGQVKGFDIDLINELSRRMAQKHKLEAPIKVRFQQVLSSTRIIGLNMGKLDLVAATMTITPEREKLIDFSDNYYTAHQAVLVPDNSRFKSVHDMKKSTILYVIGTTSEQNIRLALPTATFKGFKNSVEAFSALKAGRGDAMTSDDTILYGFIGDTCQYHLMPEELSREPYGLGIRQDDTHHATQRFRLMINELLQEMKADGTLKALEKKWMAPYRDLSICQPKTN